MFTKKITHIATMLLLSGASHAQLSITNLETDYFIDFDASLLGVNLGALQGLGLVSSPLTIGQLDSRAWAVYGLSDGDVAFGGTGLLGDYSRGISQGGATDGGLYAFNTGSIITPDYSLGIQQSADDGTPGSIRLRLQNNTGTATIRTLEVSYDIYVYNDQNKASSIKLNYGKDDLNYYELASPTVSTTESASGSPMWTQHSISKTIYGLAVETGDYFYLEWAFEEVGGTGLHDEIAIDNIAIKALDSSPSILITEIMYAPNSTEPDYEWVEIYNNSTDPIDLEGFILFDNSGLSTYTVLSSQILEPQTGINLINQTITEADFQSIWGDVRATPINLPSLSNSGTQIALWGNEAYFGSLVADALDSVNYKNGVDSWPTVSVGDGASIYRTTLPSSGGRVLSGSWAKSSDGSTTPAGNTYSVSSSEGGGSDTGSPYGETALPVTWLYVRAHASSVATSVAWGTATESNNSHFEIMTSANGMIWDIVSSHPATGNSQSSMHYSASLPPVDKATYVRIKQVDFDGSHSYSQIILIAPDRDGELKISPNLITGHNRDLNIECTQNLFGSDLRILDSQGAEVASKNLSSSFSKLELSRKVTRGCYFVYLQTNDRIVFKSRIVLK